MLNTRKIALACALAVAAIASTGCSTTSANEAQRAYYESEKARFEAIRDIAKAKASAQALTSLAAAQAVENADSSAKAAVGVTLGLQDKGQAEAGSEAIVAGKAPMTMEDRLFRWSQLVLGVAVPAVVQDRANGYNAEVQMNSSNNSLEAQKSTNGVFGQLAGQIKPNYNNSFNTYAPAAPAAAAVEATTPAE